MTTRRMIDPAFWQSETIASLSRCQRLLFIGLFSNADDQGRLRGNPALIRSTVFPFDDIPSEEIGCDLAAIERVGSIVIYEADGREFIQITGWWDYQTPQWAYPSKYPAPPEWNDRLRYRENNIVITKNWNGKGANGAQPPAAKSPKKPAPPSPLGDSLPEPLPDSLPEPLPKTLPKTLPKALPKALPKPLGGPVEIRLELGLGLKNNGGGSLGVARPREKSALSPPPTIPAYKIWVDSGLSKGIHDLDIKQLDEVVGRSPPRLELFGKICTAWRSLGWKKTNVAGVLDYFRRDEIPGQDQEGHSNGHKSKRAGASHISDAPPAGIDPGTWQRLNRKG